MTTHPATQTRKLTSEYMLEFMYKIEAKLKRKLTQFEAASPLYLAAARLYAEAKLDNPQKAEKANER